MSVVLFEMAVIPTVSGGISLLSSSLMPYRTLLTSCDDMNIYVVPLYRPHGGKIQNGISDILCFSERGETIDSQERFVLIYGAKVVASIQSLSNQNKRKLCSEPIRIRITVKLVPSAGKYI